MSKPSIGKTADGELLVDVQRLLETRLLVQSNSGGGKSHLLRRVLEQTAPLVQQIVIDIEGEFPTLREKFDYVICAPHGADAIATPATATLLARRLRETRVSAIIDLYELKMHDRKRFVRLFLEELIDAPKSLWHPALVVVDEAHHFCPEKGHGESESAEAVIDLATRGRKRGLSALLATQRLSKLNKDAAAELLNKLIGRTGLDLDVKRAADDIGMTPKEAIPILRSLEPGEFYCFGPALSKTVTKVMVGPVQTKAPKAGQHALTTPPAPSDKIRKVLADLADLPKEAEAELRTLNEYKQEVTRLRRELTQAKNAQPKPAATTIKTIEKPVVGQKAIDGFRAAETAMRKHLRDIRETAKGFEVFAKIFEDTANKLSVEFAKVAAPAVPLNTGDRARVATAAAVAGPVQRSGGGNGAAPDITGPEQKILDAIAWMECLGITEPAQTAVAFLAGYVYGGGGFNNPRGALRTKGHVRYVTGDRIGLTESGRALARQPNIPLSNSGLHQAVLDRLPGPEQRLLRIAIETYPNPIADEALAERANYTAGSGGFNNPKGRLRTLGLITYPAPRQVRAADLLFPEGVA